MSIRASRFKKYTATVNGFTQAKSAASYPDKKTPVLKFTAQAVYYIGASANSFIPDSLRAKIDGVVVFDYSDVTTPIEQGYMIEINGITFTNVIADNVAGQNKIIVAMCNK